MDKPIVSEGKNMTWDLTWLPDFLIVGAAKTGTTSLYYYLDQHPALYLPPLKEPRFFTCFGVGSDVSERGHSFEVAERVCTLDGYHALFEARQPWQLAGEASTDYLFAYETAIRNMKALYSKAGKEPAIIIMLRDPVERAWSHYMMHRRDGKEPLDFPAAASAETVKARRAAGWPMSFDYLGYGRYAGQVAAYLHAFPRVHVCFYEDLSVAPEAVVRGIFTFLGVEQTASMDTSKRFNASGRTKTLLHGLLARLIYQPNLLKQYLKRIFPKSFRFYVRTSASGWLFKKQEMPQSVVEFLTEYYRDDVAQLRDILGHDFPGWCI